MNYYFFSMLLLFSVSVNSQTIVFTGKLLNTNGDSVELFLRDNTGKELSLGSAPVGKEGDFYMKAEIPGEGEYSWKYGPESTDIYLTPGDSLHVIQDVTQFDKTIEYSGTHPAHSNYLAQYFLKFMDSDRMDIYLPGLMQRVIPTLDPEPFLQYVDSLTGLQIAFLDEWKESLTEQFYDREVAKYTYSPAYIKTMYPLIRSYYAENQEGVEPVSIPEGYYKFF